MKRGSRFPDDQAEVTFSDVFVEQLEDLDRSQMGQILSEVVALCENPGGKHPLSKDLTGWNTQAALGGSMRIIYRAVTSTGSTTSLIEVLCVGHRRNDEAYDVARNLIDAGLLEDETVTQIWDALDLLDVLAEDFGLDGWDYRPEPAPEGLQRAAVASGLMTADEAELLSTAEITAAMEGGWTTGEADPTAALTAALNAARNNAVFSDAREILAGRRTERCNKLLPRAGGRCVRRKGHPGACRRTP